MDLLRLATAAMGTRFEVVLGGLGADRLRPAGEAALETIADWHDRLSLFDAGSFLTHLNTHADHRVVDLDDEMVDLLAECLDIHHATGGAFDVAVAPLMQAWGFHDGHDENEGNVVPAAGGDAVALDTAARTIRFTRPGVALDLGGIGKGHALDHAGEVLRENGIDTALLHGGTSTVLAIGTPPDTDGWRVRIAGVSGAVTLRDEALSVSAPHGREIEVAGRPMGHVLDPRTGWPSEAATLAAVVGPSARTADAWSTALLVLGERPETMPADYASLVVTDDGEYRVCEPAGRVFEFDGSAVPACEEIVS